MTHDTRIWSDPARILLALVAGAIIMATDRILDMMRTAVNVFGDTCGAAIIARSEGEGIYNRSPTAQR